MDKVSKIVTATDVNRKLEALKTIVDMHSEALSRLINLVREMKEGGDKLAQGQTLRGMDERQAASEAERIVRQIGGAVLTLRDKPTTKARRKAEKKAPARKRKG
jgi:hypothetical protein